MPKTWKDRTCDECDFCVSKKCRINPPPQGMSYTSVGKKPACSKFEIKK